MDSFFAALRRSPLTRSDNRIVAGVCAGLAERIGVSPAIVRVTAFVLGWFTPILPLYLLAVLLLPNRRGEIRFERAVRGGHGGSIALLVVTALMIFPGSFWDGGAGWLWLVGLSVAAGFFLANRSRRTTHTLAPASTTPAPTPWSSNPPPPAYGPTASGPQDASPR
jgi:phage shock protein PspC (stress-responsive transcriptional regulator)